MEAKNPDVISHQVINIMFPPDDQPNLAEQGIVVDETIYLDESGCNSAS